jgi:hypothetical protein
MPSDHADPVGSDVDAPIPIRRCACGRVALSRCWLGQMSPAGSCRATSNSALTPPKPPENRSAPRTP